MKITNKFRFHTVIGSKQDVFRQSENKNKVYQTYPITQRWRCLNPNRLADVWLSLTDSERSSPSVCIIQSFPGWVEKHLKHIFLDFIDDLLPITFKQVFLNIDQ